MADAILIAAVLAFFAGCVLYVGWCDRIIGPDEFGTPSGGASPDTAATDPSVPATPATASSTSSNPPQKATA